MLAERPAGDPEPAGCMLASCSDAAYATIRFADSVPPASYLLLLTVDQKTLVCRLSLPARPPESNRHRAIVRLGEVPCEERPPHFEARLMYFEKRGMQVMVSWLEGDLPKKVKAELRRDDRRVAIASGEISYENFQPNGPLCAPLSRQGNVLLVLGPSGTKKRTH